MTDFDLSKITMPFGTLRGKIRRALKAHFAAGGEIEAQLTNVVWYLAPDPEWAAHRVYRAKPLQPAPLNHAGCDTPAVIFAAVREWQEARVALMKPMPREDVFSTHDLMQAAIEKLEAVRVPE